MSDESVSVSFEGKRYHKQPGESVLETLLRGGANVSFSCRKGSCRICAMQLTEGRIPPEAQQTLSAEQRAADLFLPCMTRECSTLRVQRPDPTSWVSQALVASNQQLGPDVFELQLEPGLDASWRPGQFINVRGPEDSWRSYSICSLRRDDYFMTLLIKRWPDGQVSHWLSQLAPGDGVEYQGPFGSCTYDPAHSAKPMLLIGTGTGAGTLLGVARDALAQNHGAVIQFYYGCKRREELCLHERLQQVAANHDNFEYHPVLSKQPSPGITHGRITDLALAENRGLDDHRVYLCGNPEAVQAARSAALMQGAQRSNIFADPFDGGPKYQPRDRELLDAIVPSEELWVALKQGPGLTEILENFYTRAYADPRWVGIGLGAELVVCMR